MNLRFMIDPLAYLIMVSFEVMGMYLLASIFTRIKTNISRLVICTTIAVVTIFILDMYMFKFHKTPIRSMVIFSMLLLYFKIVNNITWKKSLIQNILVFLVCFGLDVVIQIIVSTLLSTNSIWMYDYFSFLYAIYLAFMYMVIVILETINIKILDLN